MAAGLFSCPETMLLTWDYAKRIIGPSTYTTAYPIMRKTTAFITADGVVHADAGLAHAHARRRYDSAMTSIRNGLVAKLDQTRAASSLGFSATEWIEEHFEEIAHAAALKADTLFESDE